MKHRLTLAIVLQLTCGTCFATSAKNCPTDKKELQKLVERFEEKEACKRMTITECGILTGATAAGATVTAAVMAKRAIFLGDSKMPSVAFSCKNSVTENLWKTLLLPPAYAMQACTFKPFRTQEEALKKYLELSQTALKDKMAEMSANVENEVKKSINIADGSNSPSAPLSSNLETVVAKTKSELTKAFGDATKAEKAMNLLKGYADSNLSNEYLKGLSKEERELMTKANQAYQKANSQISNARTSVPKNTALSSEAKEELRKIVLQGKDGKETALKALSQWSSKFRVPSKTISEISKSIEQVNNLAKQSELFNLYQGRFDEVSMALNRGSKVTKELLTKMPSLESLQTPKMLEVRNLIAAKSGVGILGILDPISAFAESKLMSSNIFLRSAGKIAVRAGGLAPNLVFAAGNDNFTLDHDKSCIKDKSSEATEYHPQLVDFDDNCNGSVEYNSEKFQNFLALPTINKVELLSSNYMIRNAYCPLLKSSNPGESYDIACINTDNFSFKSKSGPSVSRVFSIANSQNGIKITSDFDDSYTNIKQCPKTYSYEVEHDSFVAADGSKLSKACSLNTTTLDSEKYELMKVSECCKGSSDTFCLDNHIRKTSNSTEKTSTKQDPQSGIR